MSVAASRTSPDTWQVGPVEVAYSHDGLHISTRTQHVFVYAAFVDAFVDAVVAARDARRADLRGPVVTARAAQHRLVRNLQVCAGYLTCSGVLSGPAAAFLDELGVDHNVAAVLDRLDKERHILDLTAAVGGEP